MVFHGSLNHQLHNKDFNKMTKVYVFQVFSGKMAPADCCDRGVWAVSVPVLVTVKNGEIAILVLDDFG